MCGIVAIRGRDVVAAGRAATGAIHYRGPDADGEFAGDGVYLGHRRLAILDLSERGRQPMTSESGRWVIVFNGEIYNYLELRAQLGDVRFRGDSDSEVLLAAWDRWGPACLDRLIGMFAFALWDTHERRLHLVRDRFGVKPLYIARRAGAIVAASELAAIFAAGVEANPDPVAWSSYLVHGTQEHGTRTFWSGVEVVPAGHRVEIVDDDIRSYRWYDIAAASGHELDTRSVDEVKEEYTALLRDSVALRFRADVPVGINLSGGLDSSVLLGAVAATQPDHSRVEAFTFVTGDERYDELPWVQEMLRATGHPHTACKLAAEDVPDLAASVHRHVLEPYGGVPTLAYARLFEIARARGVIVLLDGQGMDEQWAGYDYYRRAGAPGATSLVQGSSASSPLRPGCVDPAFAALAAPAATVPSIGDPLRDAQIRDLTAVKLPRALRYNDRVSMRSSTELREPFLDHRLVELALRQPRDRKIDATQGKVLLREIAARHLPSRLVEAPKRPVQTPQREWLAGPLLPWVTELVDAALASPRGTWLDAAKVRAELAHYATGTVDNSFHIWQWISLGLLATGPKLA